MVLTEDLHHGHQDAGVHGHVHSTSKVAPLAQGSAGSRVERPTSSTGCPTRPGDRPDLAAQRGRAYQGRTSAGLGGLLPTGRPGRAAMGCVLCQW